MIPKRQQVLVTIDRAGHELVEGGGGGCDVGNCQCGEHNHAATAQCWGAWV